MEQPFLTAAAAFLQEEFGDESSKLGGKAAGPPVPTLQGSCLPTRTTQMQYPKVLVFIGKHEQFACSVAPPCPSASTWGWAVKGSQVVAVSCRVAR